MAAPGFALLAPDSDRESGRRGISARVHCRTLHSRATELEQATRTRSAGHRYSAVHSVARRHSVNHTRLLLATRSANSLVDCSAEHRRRQVEGKSWNGQCADPGISSSAARRAGSHVMLKHPAARSPGVYPCPADDRERPLRLQHRWRRQEALLRWAGEHDIERTLPCDGERPLRGVEDVAIDATGGIRVDDERVGLRDKPQTGNYSAARARVAFVSHRRGPGRARRKVGPNGKRHLKRQFARVSRVQ